MHLRPAILTLRPRRQRIRAADYAYLKTKRLRDPQQPLGHRRGDGRRLAVHLLQRRRGRGGGFQLGLERGAATTTRIKSYVYANRVFDRRLVGDIRSLTTSV
ncbi:uncharacterized protein PpBr36_10787 [Pyricularia pennisetigena]|uniref:uncharacterized protein n=1 Tax=Pyricularia pennisetigena TaxID=1578925 RepID=UPI0011518338|nr:uncharacterized protein PpBr36_10787 [Pyricularia pennisetigena]TLS20992.1 hypothetical protein PpBr36_10787 [Pyricularia pennisetigena]